MAHPANPTGLEKTLTADGTVGPIQTVGPVNVSGIGTHDGTSTVQRLVNGTYQDVTDAAYTANFDQVIDFPENALNSVQIVLSSSTSSDIDYVIQYADKNKRYR